MSVSAAPAGWMEANQRHLGAALDAVRAALERHLHPERAAAGLEEARAAFAAAEEEAGEMPAPPALGLVCAAFGLSAFERDVLLLCAGAELDSRFRPLLAAVAPPGQAPAPTFGLALAALPGAHWSALAPGAPLRRWRLVELEPGPSVTRGALWVDERVLHHLTGVEHLDGRLAALVEPVAAGAELAPSHQELARRLAGAWVAAAGGPLPAIQLSGASRSSTWAVAAAACAGVGLGLHALPAHLVPVDARELELLTRLWERESRLASCALLVDCDGLDPADAAREQAVARLVDECAAPVIVANRGRPRMRQRTLAAFTVAGPTAAEQRALWRQALGDLAAPLDGGVDRLAAQFDLSAAEVRAVCARAGAAPGASGPAGLEAALWEACRESSRFEAGSLAERIVPVATRDDLVLPEPQMRVLDQIALHVAGRHRVHEDWGFARSSGRGLAISALFAGPSGTGKTMAAEVLANLLRLDLYRIDLSQVVSKYVGDTEKNLRRLFDSAEAGGAILLFDEADALFGKRTEVRDSHDRYANIEVAYLLQRLEAYHGLAILTTNLKDALDAAFLRRIRFTLHFPFPAEAERAEIWRRVFPRETPTEGLDVARLARLNVAGGSIRNIALGAAFLAARDDRPVRMADVVEAARAEYAKLQKPLTGAEMGGLA